MKKMVKMLIVALILSIAANSFAQDREVGAYERKSVAFLNIALTKGNRLNREQTDKFIQTIQNAVRMPRFDYNNIPKSVVDEFLKMPETMSIEERMNNSVVPAILAAVDAEKEMRAQNLLTEQQRNSFITDKAKELGITETELNSVMNAAYIFAPVYINHSTERYDSKDFLTGKVVPMFKVSLTAGGYWWRIDNSGETPSVKPIGRIERTAIGTEETSISNYQTVAFNLALNGVASDIGIATKALPDFKLTGQILDKNLRNVVVSIGKPEGVTVDNKYYIIESREDADGNVSEKQRGWVMVTKVGEDAKGLDSMQSQAQIISGAPYLGAKLEEIPVQPIDVTIGVVGVPYNESKKSGDNFEYPFEGLKLGYMFGPKLKISANTAALFGGRIPQFWLNLNGEITFGSVEGEDVFGNKFESAMAYGGEISITKKFYARRFAFAPEIGASIKNLDLSIASNPLLDLSWSQLIFGGFVNLGVEYAIHPQFNLGVFGGFNFAGGGDMWKLKLSSNSDSDDDISSGRYSTGYKTNATGLAFGLYGTYSIPSGSKQQRQNDTVK